MDAANNTIRIGDANYAIIAAAGLPVCNRVYGAATTSISVACHAPPSIAP